MFGKILGGILLGVGAVAAAPFTGGGSILGAASLAGSLAGAGTIATGAGVVGGVAGAVVADLEEDEQYARRKEARESGFKNGYTQGSTDTMKKLAAKIKSNNQLRLGVFALAYYVANVDGEFAKEEQDEIEKAIGRPDSAWVPPELKEEYYKIFNANMSFNEIMGKYLLSLDKETFAALDTLVMDVIKADNVVTDKERNFLDYDWAILRRLYA